MKAFRTLGLALLLVAFGAAGELVTSARVAVARQSASGVLFPPIPRWPATLPAPPTRDEAIHVQLSLQGLEVQTQQYGLLPWFDVAIGSLDLLQDRQQAYAVKHAAGDRHVIAEFFDYTGASYDEPGQPYSHIPAKDWESNPAGFRALVIEQIQAGFIPLLVPNGDNADNPEMHSPASGYPNARRQLPILIALMKGGPGQVDLNPYVVYGRLWDGVFYGSSPANIAEFGRYFRSLLPDGYLVIEHQPGRIPTGEGGGDWLPDGAMSTYDGILAEIDGPPANNTVWQIAGRTIRPYTRGPDQPAGDDPNPPFYLAPPASYQGKVRGPYAACAFEWAGTDAQGRPAGIYYWVRSHEGADRERQRQANADFRAYLRARGYRCVG